MKYVIIGLTIILACLGTCFSPKANASDTALIYHSSYQDSHTNVKDQLEADGYTVTLSTSGFVASNLINSYDIVVDLKYNSNCGSTC